MRTPEREWKAALLFRTWSAIMKATGMVPNKPSYAKLSEFEKTPFRVVAESREFSHVEQAWKSRRSRQYEALKSPYKEAKLHPSTALGSGRGPRRG